MSHQGLNLIFSNFGGQNDLTYSQSLSWKQSTSQFSTHLFLLNQESFQCTFLHSVLKAASCTTDEPAHFRLGSHSCPLLAQGSMQLTTNKSCMLCKAALQSAILNRDQLPADSQWASESLSDPKLIFLSSKWR